ncbi:MAG: cupin domain-containing protein [Bradyrhizobium sp.]|nr:cupin domain-containing protein [Bradyrhizobium sp.]
MSGSLRDEYGNYGAGAWIRNPARFRRSLQSPEGATYRVKRGHQRPAS